MAETIRDVLIRVAIKQIDAKMKAPDITPVIAAIEKVKEFEKKATDEIRLRENKFRADDIKMKDDAVRKSRFKEIAMAEMLAATVRRINAEDVANASHIMRAEQAQRRRFVDEWISNERRVALASQQNARRTAMVVTGFAEGAMRFARGMALMAAGNKDLEKIALTLLSFQAGIDILGGLNHMLRASALALGTFRLAMLNGATAMGALAAVFSPIGLMIGAGVATYFAAKYAIDKYVESVNRETKAIEEKSKAYARFRGWREAVDTNDSIRMKPGTAEQQAARLMARDAANDRQLTQLRQFIDLQKEKRELEAGRPGETAIGRLNAIGGGIAEQNQNLAGIDVNKMNTQAVREREALFLGRIVELRKENKQILEGERQMLTQMLGVENQRLEAIKNAMRTEEARANSIKAQFGLMNQMDQMELERLGKKFQRGEKFTKEEVIRFKQIAPENLQPIGDKMAAGLGQVISDRISKLFGVDPGAPLRKLADDRNKQAKEIEEATKVADEASNKLGTEIAKLLAVFAAFTAVMNELRANAERQREAAAANNRAGAGGAWGPVGG